MNICKAFFLWILTATIFAAIASGQTTYTSTVSGGAWSSGTTWVGNLPPSNPSDIIVIADGATVTINTDVSVASITVGEGTSGILTFDGTSRTVAISGDVSVTSGATFITQASGTATHSMVIGGNLVNNGIFDMSRNGTTFLCSVTFNKAGTQTISGTGSLTRFRTLTLDKGAVSNKVVASIDVAMGGSQLFFLTNGTWEQSSGTLSVTSGSQTIAADGALSILGSGSFNMAIAGSITVAGTLTVNTSGTFAMGSGNNSLTVGTSGTLILTAGTVNINGRLTLSGGTTTINGANIFVDPQASNTLGATSNTFEVSGVGNITFSSGSVTLVDPNAAATTGRDLKIGATTGGTVDFSGGTIYFGDGTSISTSTGNGFLISNNTASPITLGNIVLRTGGSAGRNVSLSTGVLIGGTLTLTSGTLTSTTANLLTLGPSATVSGGSSASYIDGPMAHTVASTGSTAKTFPIGKGTAYRPLSLTLTQDANTSTTYRAEVFNSSPVSRSLPGSIDRVSSVRYWNITKGAGANVTDASITLSYDTDDGVTDPTNLRVVKDDGAGSWVDLGGTGSAATTGTIASTVSFSSFSDFTLGNNTSGGNPLPVQLASFTGRVSPNSSGVLLEWRTISEINNFGFYVERRHELEQLFSEVANSFVPGSGTTNQPRYYSFTDNTVTSSGLHYYRLKQVDLDGSIHRTEPITVQYLLTSVPEVAPREFRLLQNYPNPFNPATEITFSVEHSGRTTLDVYNLVGQKVAALFDDVAEAGRYYRVRFAASDFSSGVYLCRLQNGSQRDIKRMMLLK